MSTSEQPPKRDLLDNDLSSDERELLELYHRLRKLSARTNVSPCISMNAKQAMVMLWNVCTDLGLIYEETEAD